MPGAAEVVRLALPDLALRAGGVVREHHALAWSWGEGPAVLLVHALTGDARADTWWAPLVGPGRPLDPARYRLVCVNNLGSCYGSSGPTDPGFPDGARLDTLDQASALWMALDALGVGQVHLAAGGSLGGMIALALAALRPACVERLLPICACATSSAWIVGFNHVQRQAIALDPARGLEVARQLATLTYRAAPGLERRQPRGTPPPCAAWPHRVQGYLEHQGRALRDRYDARSYLAQLDAMDAHDVADRLGAVRAPALVVDIDTDVLFPPAQSDALAALLPNADRATLRSEHGHDGFLIEWEGLAPLVRRALALTAAAGSRT